ncbi:MAG: TolC family protein [Bacteroidales bacterium]|nr:TolC family protein [Bacteroidales bacterium]
MVKRTLILLPILLVLVSLVVNAQKIWTLDECIQHAYENNLDIKRQRIQVKSAEFGFWHARSQVLPTANAFGNYTYNKGRAPNYDTYQYVDTAFKDGNVGIESRLNIFNGLYNYHSMRSNHFNLLSQLENVEHLKDNIAINIAGAYLQILLNQELLSIAQDQLEITQQQVARNEKLVELGTLSRGDLFQIQAQKATERANVIKAENTLEISYLTLAQYMDLESGELSTFAIIVPELTIDDAVALKSVDNVYGDALENLAAVKSAEFLLKSQEKNLSAARGLRYPSISARFLYYTLYSEISVNPLDPVAPYRWNEQVQDKGYQQLSFSLNIPLFNRLDAQNQISRSKVSMLDAQVVLEQTKQTLYKAIQQAYADANAALEDYEAFQEAVRSMEEAFYYAEQRYNVGILNSVDYNTAKNNLTKAQSDLLQAKYQYIFYAQILDFYGGNSITL